MNHRIAIAGSSGRMGRMLIEAVLAADDCQLAAALDQPGSPALGQDAGNFLGQTTGVAIAADLQWTPVSGLLIGPEVAWNRTEFDTGEDFDEWGVMWRIQRDF